MTTCDWRTHNVCVGDVVRLLDDNQNRVLKITPPLVPSSFNAPIIRLIEAFYELRHNYLWALPAWSTNSRRRTRNPSQPMTPSSRYSRMLWTFCCACIQPRPTVLFGQFPCWSTLVCGTHTSQRKALWQTENNILSFKTPENSTRIF